MCVRRQNPIQRQAFTPCCHTATLPISYPKRRCVSKSRRTGFQSGTKRDVATIYELLTDEDGHMTFAEPLYSFK